jgi:hypothetical protein
MEQRMTVRLGLVVPVESRTIFERAVRDVAGVQVSWALYADEDSIPSLVQEVAPGQEVLCFAGPLPLERARAVIPPNVSVVDVRPSRVDLAVSFLQARNFGIDLTPVSIDSLPRKMVDDLLVELGLDSATVAVMPFDKTASPDDIVRFHREQNALLGTRYVITGRNSVFRLLDGTFGAPVVRVVPTAATIANTIRGVTLEALSARKEDLRLCAAVFKAVAAGDGDVDAAGSAEVIRRILAEDLEWGNAWIETTRESEVLVLGHKKLMEDKTLGWRFLSVLEEMSAKTEARVVAGIGLGSSAQGSIDCAHQALELATQRGEGCAYLITDAGEITGPMVDHETRAPNYLFKSDDVALENIVQAVGLGLTTVTRLIDLERQLGGAATSAEEVGRNLNVTPPSARRILRVLRGAGLAHPVGSSQATGRGRPTRLYRIDIAQMLYNQEGLRR